MPIKNNIKPTDGSHAAKFVDEAGTPYGVKHVGNKMRVSSMPYLYDIAEGNVTGHVHWEKIGYSAVSGTTTKDVWSYTDNTINLPTAATAMEVYTNNAQDRASDIFSGTSSGGSLIQLVDATKDFTGGTAVAIGDCIVLDETGAAGTPEYGFVTGITNATTLAVAGGFSSGGTGSGRAYSILDYSAYSGAQAVLIKYLTIAFVEKSEIVLLGGNAVGVDLINTDVYRINSFRVIAAGSGGVAAAAIQIQDADGSAPIYSYITVGYSRARNSLYTVPTGKTLYITQFSCGYVTTANQIHNARIILRATQDNEFRTPSIFHVLAELLCPNLTIPIELTVPIKIMSGVTLKFTAVPTANGQVTTVARGWVE